MKVLSAGYIITETKFSGLRDKASEICPCNFRESMAAPVEKTYEKKEKGLPSLLSTTLSPKLKV